MELRRGIIRRCERQYVRERLEEYGIQPLEGQLLRLLKECQCTKQEDLCELIDVDKGRIARALSKLEEMGLVKRTVNSNSRREKIVELTDKGNQILEVIAEIYKDWGTICFEGFSEEEIEIYSGFLARIAENVKHHKRGGF